MGALEDAEVERKKHLSADQLQKEKPLTDDEGVEKAKKIYGKMRQFNKILKKDNKVRKEGLFDKQNKVLKNVEELEQHGPQLNVDPEEHQKLSDKDYIRHLQRQ